MLGCEFIFSLILTIWNVSQISKAKIEHFLSTSKQTKALILLRQLKFVETTMFHGIDPYCDQPPSQSATSAVSSTYANSISSANCQNDSNEPIATDAEVILIDML